MTGPATVLALDLGTSGAKGALVTLDGGVIGWKFCPIETRLIGNDGAEQSPHAWWDAVCQVSRQLMQSSDPSRVVAVCASTQGEGTVPVDRDGTPLGDALLWLDMRGREALSRRVAGGLIRVAGYNARKLARWIRLTGGAPALSGKDPAGHMLLIQQQWPDVYRRTYKFLNVLDYLNFRLTGRMVATVDSILTSWVTDNRDLERIGYDQKLINALGIDREKLPEIIHCTDVVGPVSAAAAAELQIPAGTSVVAGTIDTAAAAIGSGAVGDGHTHLYVGTSSWLAAHVPYKRTDLIAQVASVPCALRDRYLMIALQSSAGSNLSFLRDQVFFHRDELLKNEELPNVYRLLDQIATRVPAGSDGLIYTPWLFGERCPVEDATVRAGFLNLSMQHSREEMIRAVMEGVALNTRWMMASVKKFLRHFPLDEITIVGGGGASDIWCQIFADVLDVRIRQLESPLQANVLGSAFIAGVGIGAMRFDDVPALTRTKHLYEPTVANRAVYDQAFADFTEIYRRLAPLYRRMNRRSDQSRKS